MKLTIGPDALLLAALAYFFDRGGVLAAVLCAAIVHEAGHAAALRICGCGIRRVSVSALGFKMDYAGAAGGALNEAFVALAGPLAGAMLAVCASAAGRLTGSEFLLCLAGVSLVLTVFNLLPARPLDGWRLSRLVLGEDAAGVLSYAAAALLTAGGILAIIRGCGAAAFFSGAYLWLSSIKKWCTIEAQTKDVS